MFAAMLGSPGTGLQNSIGPVGPGQPSAPTMSGSTPIDPSSMQRAYAALGLPYSNQPPAQSQPQASGQQTAQVQQQQHQQMRSIGAMGKRPACSMPF